ncbi:MAG: hypothetical protein ACK5V3_10195 [Bdellovibrionales bacterium]
MNFSLLENFAFASEVKNCRVSLKAIIDPSINRFEINRHGLQNKSHEDFAMLRYGDLGIKALESLKNIGKEFEVLIVDPGIVARIIQFVEFVSKNNLEMTPPKSVRSLFASVLGKKTMYRALVLNEKEMNDIKQNGMKAVSLINSKSHFLTDYPLLQMFWKRRSDNPFPDGDPMISITVHPEIAVAAASIFLYRNSKPIFGLDLKFEKKDIYLFEIEVPVIDILIPESHQFSVLRTKHIGFSIEIQNFTRKTNTHYGYGPDVESFLLYEVHPQEILQVSKISERIRVRFGK